MSKLNLKFTRVLLNLADRATGVVLDLHDSVIIRRISALYGELTATNARHLKRKQAEKADENLRVGIFAELNELENHLEDESD